MKKSVFGAVALILILLCFIIPVFAIQITLNGCLWWMCAPERDFQIADLELPADLFPVGTIVNHIHPLSDNFGSVEDGTQSIYWKNGNGNAGYTVYRYSTKGVAEEYFDYQKRIFTDSESHESWKPPDVLSFSSETADAVYIACGDWSRRNCGMAARYQEYIVTFISVIDSDMTFSEFEKILFYIDKQISDLLYP